MADRVNQDLELVIKQPTSSLGRSNQQVLLVIKQPAPTPPNARVNQDVLLVLITRPKQPVIFVTG